MQWWWCVEGYSDGVWAERNSFMVSIKNRQCIVLHCRLKVLVQ